ncbi:hypothetical protein CRUP_032463, partial [Coryphaenoides rupestris]
ILTQEDWNKVLYNGMASTTPVAALYFIALMTFGNYVLFNLLVAILVEGFQTEEVTKREDLHVQLSLIQLPIDSGAPRAPRAPRRHGNHRCHTPMWRRGNAGDVDRLEAGEHPFRISVNGSITGGSAHDHNHAELKCPINGHVDT